MKYIGAHVSASGGVENTPLRASEIGATDSESDGLKIRQSATENNATIFTSLDTVRVLLDVLEETTLTISTIDS